MVTNDQDHLIKNKALWDERAPEHAKSPGYAVQRLLAEPDYLADTVSFDLPLLGSVDGLNVVHLMCHIGTSTLSLARLGAKSVVGLDFSSASIAAARDLVAKAESGSKVSFVEADFYDSCKVLEPRSFDLVYTGIGALCWLPSISRWAQTVSALLKPGGRLFIREGHPAMWTVDGRNETSLTIRYPYFETKEARVDYGKGTYVPTEIKVFDTREWANWNHGLGEIVQALLNEGMTITGLVEHRSIPWKCFNGVMEDPGEFGERVLKEGKDNIPLTYTLQAKKL